MGGGLESAFKGEFGRRGVGCAQAAANFLQTAVGYEVRDRSLLDLTEAQFRYAP